MANPQKENGFTAIANEIMDTFCKFRIPGELRLVVDCILRKTYGWQKKEDWIPHSQIIEMTQLKKGNVSRSLSKLITHKLVIKTDNKLRFNKNYDEWLSFKITRKKVIKKETKVIKTDNKKLSELMVSKESKETIQKKEDITKVIVAKPQYGNPELNELVEYADQLRFVLQGTKKLNRFNASNLLKKFGLEKSKRLIEAAVNCRGKPYSPTISDFTQLYRKVGDLITYYKKGQNGSRIGKI